MAVTEAPLEVMQWHTNHWQLVVGEQTQDVPVELITNHAAPDIILLPGFAEDDFIEDTVEYLGKGGLKVVGVKLTYPGTSEKDIDTGNLSIEDLIRITLANGVPLVASKFNKNADGKVQKKLHLIGNSGGAGAVLVEADRAATAALSEADSVVAAELDPYGVVGVLDPPGFTTDFALLQGKTPARTDGRRRKEFLHRMEQNGFGQMGKPNVTKSDAYRLSFTLQQTIGRQIVERLMAAGHPVRIFSGAEDPIFPPSQIRDTLGRDLERLLQVLPMRRHALLSTWRGKEDLARVGQWALRKGQANNIAGETELESAVAA